MRKELSPIGSVYCGRVISSISKRAQLLRLKALMGVLETLDSLISG